MIISSLFMFPGSNGLALSMLGKTRYVAGEYYGSIEAAIDFSPLLVFNAEMVRIVGQFEKRTNPRSGALVHRRR